MVFTSERKEFDTLLDIVQAKVHVTKMFADWEHPVRRAIQSAYIQEIKRIRDTYGYGLGDIVGVANAFRVGLERSSQ